MTLAIVATAVLILARELSAEADGISASAGPSSSSASSSAAASGLYTASAVKMTAMPQLVSLFNAVGGGAAALIAIEDYLRLAGTRRRDPHSTTTSSSSSTSSSARSPSRGSIIAAGKLQGLIPGKPIIIPGGRLVAAGLGDRHRRRGRRSCSPTGTPNVALLLVILAAALIFGITMVLPIGGADMPVVI